MSDKPRMPKKVLDAIMRVRDSGLTNMFDRPRVQKICNDWNEYAAVVWLEDHKKEYANLIFKGPDAFEITDEEVN